MNSSTLAVARFRKIKSTIARPMPTSAAATPGTGRACDQARPGDAGTLTPDDRTYVALPAKPTGDDWALKLTLIP